MRRRMRPALLAAATVLASPSAAGGTEAGLLLPASASGGPAPLKGGEAGRMRARDLARRGANANAKAKGSSDDGAQKGQKNQKREDDGRANKQGNKRGINQKAKDGDGGAAAGAEEKRRSPESPEARAGEARRGNKRGVNQKAKEAKRTNDVDKGDAGDTGELVQRDGRKKGNRPGVNKKKAGATKGAASAPETNAAGTKKTNKKKGNRPGANKNKGAEGAGGAGQQLTLVDRGDGSATVALKGSKRADSASSQAAEPADGGAGPAAGRMKTKQSGAGGVARKGPRPGRTGRNGAKAGRNGGSGGRGSSSKNAYHGGGGRNGGNGNKKQKAKAERVSWTQKLAESSRKPPRQSSSSGGSGGAHGAAVHAYEPPVHAYDDPAPGMGLPAGLCPCPDGDSSMFDGSSAASSDPLPGSDGWWAPSGGGWQDPGAWWGGNTVQSHAKNGWWAGSTAQGSTAQNGWWSGSQTPSADWWSGSTAQTSNAGWWSGSTAQTSNAGWWSGAQTSGAGRWAPPAPAASGPLGGKARRRLQKAAKAVPPQQQPQPQQQQADRAWEQPAWDAWQPPAWETSWSDAWSPPPKVVVKLCPCTDPPSLRPTDAPSVMPSEGPTPSPLPADVTREPTDDPTESPTGSPSVDPTYSPTTRVPTYSPTVRESDVPSLAASGVPSLAPSRQDEACDYLYWGAQEGRGEAPLGSDQEVPDFVDRPVRDACAGSRHSFIIDADGTPYVSGFIESFNAYKGHMGVPRDDLEEAMEVNEWVPVTEFRGPGGSDLGYTPEFNRVYPGAGAPGNSRDMHSLLIDVRGYVYTTGNNDMGQLCHGTTDNTDVFTRVPGLPSGATAAAVGLDFTLILLGDGSVWGCGSNENGELGLGRDVVSVDVPTRLPVLEDVVEVHAGLTFAVYRDRAGAVFGTGSNLFGQMCVSTEGEPYTSPTVIDVGLDVGRVQMVMAGRESTYYLMTNGKVMACGRNDEGQLGDGTREDSNEPVKVILPNNIDVRMIGSGPSSQSVFFVAEEDTVYAAGANDRHQLGLSIDDDCVTKPRLIEGMDVVPFLDRVEKVCSSGTHTLAIVCQIITKTPTSVPTFVPSQSPTISPSDKPTYMPTNEPTEEPTQFPTGSPTETPTYSPSTTPTSSPSFSPTVAPSLVPTETPTEIPTNYPTETPTQFPTMYPTMLPTESPTETPSYTPTGYPTEYPTEFPTEFPTEYPTNLPTESPTFVTPFPTQLPTLYPTEIPTMSPTFLTEFPTQLPTQLPTASPTFLTEFPTSFPTRVPSYSPTFSPTLLGYNWYFWGAEEGRGNTIGENQQVPQEIPDEIIDVSAGSRHTFLINTDGELIVAGFIESDFGYRGHMGVGPIDDCENESDQLCEGSNDPLVVIEVFDEKGKSVEMGDSDFPFFRFVYAAAGVPADSGEMHAAAIDFNGDVWVTGNNNKGQLCLGEFGDLNFRDSFHKVPGLPGPALKAQVGDEFTLILLENGDVWGCGTNEQGEIGQGEDVDISTKAVKIEDLKNINQMSAGLQFAVFLDNKNRIFATGSNLYGQMCAFTSGLPLTVPEIVFDFTDDAVIQVEAGKESSYYLFEDGSARSCGRNDEGQLGNGDFVNTDEETPIVDVDIDDEILRIESGPSSQSVFFILEESVLASGLNDRFQLGIDEIGSRDSPVEVLFDGPVEIQYISSSGTHTVANGRYL